MTAVDPRAATTPLAWPAFEPDPSAADDPAGPDAPWVLAGAALKLPEPALRAVRPLLHLVTGAAEEALAMEAAAATGLAVSGGLAASAESVLAASGGLALLEWSVPLLLLLSPLGVATWLVLDDGKGDGNGDGGADVPDDAHPIGPGADGAPWPAGTPRFGDTLLDEVDAGVQAPGADAPDEDADADAPGVVSDRTPPTAQADGDDDAATPAEPSSDADAEDPEAAPEDASPMSASEAFHLLNEWSERYGVDFDWIAWQADAKERGTQMADVELDLPGVQALLERIAQEPGLAIDTRVSALERYVDRATHREDDDPLDARPRSWRLPPQR